MLMQRQSIKDENEMFFRIKKETLKGLETLCFIDIFKKKPHLKGWVGWGRDTVGKFLSEEKRLMERSGVRQ